MLIFPYYISHTLYHTTNTLYLMESNLSNQRESIETFSNEALIEICESLKIPKHGTKKLLLNRISEYFSQDSWLSGYSYEFLRKKFTSINRRGPKSKNLINLQYYYWYNNKVQQDFLYTTIFVNHETFEPYHFDRLVLSKFIEEYSDEDLSKDFLDSILPNDDFHFIDIPILFGDINLDGYLLRDNLEYRFNSFEYAYDDIFKIKEKLELFSNYKFTKNLMINQIAIKIISKGFGYYMGGLAMKPPYSVVDIQLRRYSNPYRWASRLRSMRHNHESDENQKVYSKTANFSKNDLFYNWINHNTSIRFFIKESVHQFPDHYALIIECSMHGKFVRRCKSLLASKSKNICQQCHKENVGGGGEFKLTGKSVFYVLKHKKKTSRRYNAGISGINNYTRRKSAHRRSDGDFIVIEEIIDHSSKVAELERRIKLELLDNAGALERYKRNPLIIARKMQWVDENNSITLFPFLD